VLPQDKQPPDITEYVNATSLGMALAALADGAGTPLAGGSDLWAQKDSGNGRMRARLVNVNRVVQLHGITERDGMIRIGALTTMSDLLQSDLLAARLPVLAATADRFASDQIRNVATIGGNIANASPAADMVVTLIALDAVAEVGSAGGGLRRVAVADIATGPGRTSLKPDKLIVAIELAAPEGGLHAVFVKSGPRPALEISMVSMALAGRRSGDVLKQVRLSFGAVGPTVIRCGATENLIEGRRLGDGLIARALDVMAGEIAPIEDARASAWYRTRMARTFLQQELMKCRSR
jgi:xanthine dehydrogenase FAD-binding subunit